MYRFKLGDRVVFARPQAGADEDDTFNSFHVAAGAVGTVTFLAKDFYQYRVEYRCGALTVRNYPFDRQLDPADGATHATPDPQPPL